MESRTAIDIAALGVSTLVWIGCSLLERRRSEALQSIARSIRLGIVPPILGIFALERYGDPEKIISGVRALQTVLAVVCLWIGATALKELYYLQSRNRELASKTPRLLVDIIRLGIVTAGGLLLAAQIWQKDLSPLLTTFGVGSLVLGLALQDTLGNLFSGLSLISERPFSVGDWIQVGEISGKVLQVNWRAVRIQTRELDEVTVPNSALSKDRIINYSRPSAVSGVKIRVGFEFDAPPNKVKHMLSEVARTTEGILATPPVDIRVIAFGQYLIEYEARFFITELDSLPQIRSRFLTRVWYAARRAGIHIPYPVQSIYKTEVAPTQRSERVPDTHAAIGSHELFSTLSPEDLLELEHSARILTYAIGERIVREADEGRSLYVLLDGVCSVSVKGSDGKEVSITELRKGDIFGEMSVLTGEPRSATVTALTDVTASVISRAKIAGLLQRNAPLQEAFASYIAKRADSTKAILESVSANEIGEQNKGDNGAVLARLRKFFGI